jgi:hypothetical protein
MRQLLFSGADHNHIINCDETAWQVVPNGLLTWAPVGADGVSVELNANEKEIITVLASITAARTALPLQFVAKGRTTRAERSQCGDLEYHEVTHSDSGWTTTTTFVEYLKWLRRIYGPGPDLHLILDLYSVHRSQKVKEEAAALGIHLYFIPAGFTDAGECFTDSWRLRATRSENQRPWNSCAEHGLKCMKMLSERLGESMRSRTISLSSPMKKFLKMKYKTKRRLISRIEF